jgi:methylenetetrahydrofolate dehydrogenase (NADP+)/methenyltetrahydrofolate cyclohydrolase
MKLIDGKKIAAEIRAELKEKGQKLLEEKGITPCIALLLVGDNPASKIYVNMKYKASKEIGFKSIILDKPSDTSEEEVLSIVNKWNNDPDVHGILVQLPLPKHIDEQKVITSILPSKDVDGFHPENMGRLVLGLPGFVPCTPAGIVELINRSIDNVKGKHLVVVGRSNIVGKPIANLMYQKNKQANATVTICHTGTDDIGKYTRQADILVAAMGVPEAIKAEHVKEGATVIDVGVNRVDAPETEKGYRLCGDVDFEDVKNKTEAITPVPGGVGPMTIAMLMRNTYLSAAGELKF